MADYKIGYSTSSSEYIDKAMHGDLDLKYIYNRVKAVEALYNNDWNKTKVNINEIIERFAPNSIATISGYKIIYSGEKYDVVADMIGGYLRILNTNTNQYVKLDGKPGSRRETHYKIKKREEM